MRVLLSGCMALYMITFPSFAGSVSYLVLLRSGSDNLVRVSEDGRLRTVVATATGGYGLAIDKRGDYIVAALSSLLRVTSSGVVERIAVPPSGSSWLSVAVDLRGNYIVGDNRLHCIWRVSPDGKTIERVASYPVQNDNEWEDVGVIVDSAGDYLIMEDNSFGGHFWRISPAGQVSPIPLSGDKMTAGACIVGAGDGSYLVVSYRDSAIFRVTASGNVKRFASVSNGRNLTGLARNPETGEVVATLNFDSVLRKVSADGSSVAAFADIGYANAIITESDR